MKRNHQHATPMIVCTQNSLCHLLYLAFDISKKSRNLLQNGCYPQLSLIKHITTAFIYTRKCSHQICANLSLLWL